MSGDGNSVAGEAGISAAVALPDRVTVITGDGKSKCGFLGVFATTPAAAAEVVAAGGMMCATPAAFTSALAVNGTRQGGPGAVRCESKGGHAKLPPRYFQNQRNSLPRQERPRCPLPR